jgi:hypothetical protein
MNTQSVHVHILVGEVRETRGDRPDALQAYRIAEANLCRRRAGPWLLRSVIDVTGYLLHDTNIFITENGTRGPLAHWLIFFRFVLMGILKDLEWGPDWQFLLS